MTATTTTTSIAIRTMGLADEAPAISTLVMAFAADPMARWTWPDAHTYLVNMPALVRAFGGGAFSHEGAHGANGYAGVALWLPPGTEPDGEALEEIVERTAPPEVRKDAPGIFEQMANFHPKVPHWYLPLIGVDPAHRGQRLGEALMSYALDRCDRDHLPAYLESSNPRNLTLYQRHGFEPLGTIQSGTSPQVVPMLRRPRRPQGRLRRDRTGFTADCADERGSRQQRGEQDSQVFRVSGRRRV